MSISLTCKFFTNIINKKTIKVNLDLREKAVSSSKGKNGLLS